MKKKKFLLIAIVAVLLVTVMFFIWYAKQQSNAAYEGLINGNGRVEATEFGISAKIAGRIERVLVSEGDYVKKGQPLVIMQTNTLEAQLAQAQAQRLQALSNEVNARAQTVMRMNDITAAEANVVKAQSDLNLAQAHLRRSSALHRQGAIPVQQYDDDQAKVKSTQAALNSANAQVALAQASVDAAKANEENAVSAVKVADAGIAVIQTQIDESTLVAPVDGRIQYQISQAGEVIAAGGKVLNLIDLSDVYLTLFIPETAVGRISLGDEVRLKLDALPEYIIPARVSYIADVAQFTPKTVETQSERQKLMFRIKAQIPPELLRCYIESVKTGLPGVAWLRIDPQATWPAELSNLVPQCSSN